MSILSNHKSENNLNIHSLVDCPVISWLLTMLEHYRAIQTNEACLQFMHLYTCPKALTEFLKGYRGSW